MTETFLLRLREFLRFLNKGAKLSRERPDMSAPPKDPATCDIEAEKCLARSVADALAQNPALEAVTINRARHTISVATLGNTDVPKLTERISATVRRAEETAGKPACALLAGAGALSNTGTT